MEITVNNDLRKYKSKDIGMFTFKEAGILVVAFAAAFACRKAQIALMGEASLGVTLFPAVIVAVLGFMKPCGLTIKECFESVFQEWFFLPRSLIWESNFEEEESLEEENKVYTSKKDNKRKRKDVKRMKK